MYSNSMSDNRDKYCIFSDVSKALYGVSDRGLMCKLERYVIKGNLLVTQSVFVIGWVLSKPRILKADVPHVSVLLPFLFIVFVNDIADELDCITRTYADDTAPSFSSTNN